MPIKGTDHRAFADLTVKRTSLRFRWFFSDLSSIPSPRPHPLPQRLPLPPQAQSLASATSNSRRFFRSSVSCSRSSFHWIGANVTSPAETLASCAASRLPPRLNATPFPQAVASLGTTNGITTAWVSLLMRAWAHWAGGQGLSLKSCGDGGGGGGAAKFEKWRPPHETLGS